MKILFIGELSPETRSYQRFKALRQLGHELRGISYIPHLWRQGIDRESIFARIMWKLRLPIDAAGVNRQMKTIARQEKFDIVWIDKGNTMHPSALRAVRKILPAAKLVSCSEDDMYARHNRTIWYTLCLPLYDIVFTTKVYNLEELKKLGARRTALFIDAFDPEIHRPLTLTPEEKEKFGAEVSFIGSFEEDRAEQMLYLADQGIPVRVWGSNWEDWKNKNPNLRIEGHPVYGEDFIRAINGSKINLGFLRKRNRDETTSRSVEIPACGAFMLAERTSRHQALFEEGKEAEFFGSREELLEKILHYLSREEDRRRIAAAGRERCIRSGYDQQSQLREMLKEAAAARG